MELIIYNNLKDKGKVFKFASKKSIDQFAEELDDWGNEHLEEQGFFEVDIIDDKTLMIDTQ